MTDEEMAEQFNKDNCIWWEYDSLSVDEEMADKYIKDNCERWECDCLSVDDIAKENFLAGLKAGRPQWHDLEKDPKDLPKKNKSYWVYIDCQGNKIYRSIVWQGCWLGWDCIPLAWCEEPTFDKE